MSDFRLKVFQSVAKNLSFTKASQELFVSQPAITKHIQELYLQPIITQYFIDNKSEIWLLFLIAHSKR